VDEAKKGNFELIKRKEKKKKPRRERKTQNFPKRGSLKELKRNKKDHADAQKI
jgi:hypothetical protein